MYFLSRLNQESKFYSALFLLQEKMLSYRTLQISIRLNIEEYIFEEHTNVIWITKFLLKDHIISRVTDEPEWRRPRCRGIFIHFVIRRPLTHGKIGRRVTTRICFHIFLKKVKKVILSKWDCKCYATTEK